MSHVGTCLCFVWVWRSLEHSLEWQSILTVFSHLLLTIKLFTLRENFLHNSSIREKREFIAHRVILVTDIDAELFQLLPSFSWKQCLRWPKPEQDNSYTHSKVFYEFNFDVALKTAVAPASAPGQVPCEGQIFGRLVSLGAAFWTAASAPWTSGQRRIAILESGLGQWVELRGPALPRFVARMLLFAFPSLSGMMVLLLLRLDRWFPIVVVFAGR